MKCNLIHNRVSKIACRNQRTQAIGDRYERERGASRDTLAIVVELESIELEGQGSKSRVRAELARTIHSGKNRDNCV